MCIFSRKKKEHCKRETGRRRIAFCQEEGRNPQALSWWSSHEILTWNKYPCFFLTPHSHSFTKPASWWTWTSAAQTTSSVSARATFSPATLGPTTPSISSGMTVVDHSPTHTVLHRQLFRVCLGRTAFLIPCRSHNHSPRGTELRSLALNCAALGVTVSISLGYPPPPHSSDQTERTKQTLEKALRCVSAQILSAWLLIYINMICVPI